MSDVNRERLRALLRDFAPGSAYSIAPKAYVLRGIDYCRAGRIRSFEWNADFSVLSAKVKGSRLYSVELSEGAGRLAFVCNCPAWSRYTNCKHVVCALLGINDLIDSVHPRFIPSADGYIDRLRDELSGKVRAGAAGADKNPHKNAGELRGRVKSLPVGYSEKKLEIVIATADEEITDIYLRRGGRRVTWEAFSSVPVDVRRFVPSYYNVHPKVSELSRNIEALDGGYPIILKTENGETKIKFDPSAEYAAMTGLDSCGDIVKIQRLFVSDGKYRKGLLLSGPFVFDTEAGTFSIMGHMA
jgi:hypothetical protein